MDVKMPRKTPHKSQIKNGRPSLETIEYGHSPGGLASTQFLSGGLGSLPKKIKVEDKRALSTPQSAPNSSKMCAPKIGTLENNTTTPTLPQGAAAERQHHLQKKDVRRRLDMELAPDTQSPLPTSTTSDGFKTPKAKRARTKSAAVTVPTLSFSPSPQRNRSSAVDRSRFDSSLGLLTKRFLGLLQSAENGILDLNLASVTLAVQKRRIYDITNVLEGIGLLKKISKNNIQWKGSDSPADSAESQRGLNQDLADLEAKENQLDELISSTESQLRSLSEEKRYAYVTYGDLKSIAEYRDNTVMAVRAPPETKLQVPHPSEGYQIHMKSEKSEIEVLLCPEDESSSSSSSSPSSKESSGFPSPVTNGAMRARSHRSNRSGQFMPQFSDDEDQGLLLETMDQNQQSGCESGLDISSVTIPTANEPFLCLEPPIDESAYMFSMDDAEGISNLFDFSF
ncbi:transcription factor E2F1-like [Daphnia pulex]|uniref:transcription factor E2F1-like n=1 Tax=Daphnia pulex TaxID=6669 RepID=UPI001EE06F31|nr:transcription factor E2F1-like [Daphnia pulex]XP_046442789.1 transcription factor E2F1-like [Daphnia pulex]